MNCSSGVPVALAVNMLRKRTRHMFPSLFLLKGHICSVLLKESRFANEKFLTSIVFLLAVKLFKEEGV